MIEQEKALRLQEYSLAIGNGDANRCPTSGHHGEFAIGFRKPSKYDIDDIDRAGDLRDETKKMIQQRMQLMDIRIHGMLRSRDAGLYDPFRVIYFPMCNFSGAPMRIQGYLDLLLPLLPTLQRLYIVLDANQGVNDPLRDLVAELQAIAGKNIIKTLQISYNINFLQNRDCNFGEKWAALGRAFTDHPLGWKNLRKFFLIVVVGRNVRRDGLKKLPENQLKGLAESRNWLFDFELKDSIY